MTEPASPDERSTTGDQEPGWASPADDAAVPVASLPDVEAVGPQVATSADARPSRTGATWARSLTSPTRQPGPPPPALRPSPRGRVPRERSGALRKVLWLAALPAVVAALALLAVSGILTWLLVVRRDHALA